MTSQYRQSNSGPLLFRRARSIDLVTANAAIAPSAFGLGAIPNNAWIFPTNAAANGTEIAAQYQLTIASGGTQLNVAGLSAADVGNLDDTSTLNFLMLVPDSEAGAQHASLNESGANPIALAIADVTLAAGIGLVPKPPGATNFPAGTKCDVSMGDPSGTGIGVQMQVPDGTLTVTSKLSSGSTATNDNSQITALCTFDDNLRRSPYGNAQFYVKQSVILSAGVGTIAPSDIGLNSRDAFPVETHVLPANFGQNGTQVGHHYKVTRATGGTQMVLTAIDSAGATLAGDLSVLRCLVALPNYPV